MVLKVLVVTNICLHFLCFCFFRSLPVCVGLVELTQEGVIGRSDLRTMGEPHSIDNGNNFTVVTWSNPGQLEPVRTSPGTSIRIGLEVRSGLACLTILQPRRRTGARVSRAEWWMRREKLGPGEVFYVSSSCLSSMLQFSAHTWTNTFPLVLNKYIWTNK